MKASVAVINDIVASCKAAVRNDEIDLRIESYYRTDSRASHRFAVKSQDLNVIVPAARIFNDVFEVFGFIVSQCVYGLLVKSVGPGIVDYA